MKVDKDTARCGAFNGGPPCQGRSRLNVDGIDRPPQLHAAEAETQHTKNEAVTHKYISMKTRRGSTKIFHCNIKNQTYFIHTLQRTAKSRSGSTKFQLLWQ
jgi:hypothetical protein